MLGSIRTAIRLQNQDSTQGDGISFLGRRCKRRGHSVGPYGFRGSWRSVGSGRCIECVREAGGPGAD